MAMAEGEDVRRDVRYRVGRWLGATMPSGIFGVLLLGSFGFPLATWLEWLRGGRDEPLGVEVAMLLAWLLCALLAYAWWFSARLGTAESGGRASADSGSAASPRADTGPRRRRPP